MNKQEQYFKIVKRRLPFYVDIAFCYEHSPTHHNQQHQLTTSYFITNLQNSYLGCRARISIYDKCFSSFNMLKARTASPHVQLYFRFNLRNPVKNSTQCTSSLIPKKETRINMGDSTSKGGREGPLFS